ncbi:MAG: hypothetical protein E7647_04830 [Ruminococcaceae bacterium]|nr:hypothetical protein [Oscillospiraceae bacterium]
MVYAMSDLHGCYDKYVRMLERIGFCDDDTLYILGDVVDRGPDGIKILLDMFDRKNVIPIRGNHDHMAWKLLKLTVNSENIGDDILEITRMWFTDGGIPTYKAFRELRAADKKRLLSYVSTFFYFQEIEVGEKTFFLSHTVPEKEKMMDPESFSLLEYIVGEPEYDKVYFEDKYIVTGHTPTSLIDESCDGRIYKKNNHIAIDCGAVFGSPLGCICLDTMEEFYVD